MNESIPLTLGDAIAAGPAWLQGWVLILVVVHLAAVLFLLRRDGSRWRVRLEPVAILASFVLAGLFMAWLYNQVGYVRLLGLAHLLFWTPAYMWVLTRRRAIGAGSPFGKYVHVYLLIAGISLVIDLIDVIRYMLGDGAL